MYIRLERIGKLRRTRKWNAITGQFHRNRSIPNRRQLHLHQPGTMPIENRKRNEKSSRRHVAFRRADLQGDRWDELIEEGIVQQIQGQYQPGRRFVISLSTGMSSWNWLCEYNFMCCVGCHVGEWFVDEWMSVPRLPLVTGRMCFVHFVYIDNLRMLYVIFWLVLFRI